MSRVPGAFIQTADVSFDNVLDLVLEIQETAGRAVVDYGVLPAASATPTGLANDATVYTASIDVDAPGSPVSVTITGSAAQTFTQLLVELNSDLGGAAVASLVGGQLVITSATTGVASAVVVTDGSLFRSVRGPNYALVSIQSTRGTETYVRWNALPEDTKDEWEALAATLSAGQGFKTYASDSVTVGGTGIVPASPMGLTPGNFSLAVSIPGAFGGVAQQVTVAVGAGETFASFIVKFNTALRALFPSLTATLTAATNLLTIVVTTDVAGNIASAAPTVAAGSPDLIAALTAIAAPIDFTAAAAAAAAGTEGTVGAANTPALYRAALLSTKSLAGVPFMTIIPTGAFFTRQNKPVARGRARQVAVYYNGSAWVDWTTDAAIA